MEQATFRFKIENGKLEIFVETAQSTVHAELSESEVMGKALFAMRNGWQDIEGRIRIDRPFRAGR